MDSSLMYRGLPGGPTKIKFAEELPRHCLCGHCGMITLSMYQDPDNHMFCDDCLLEQSTKHGVYHIFCSYESRNIAIHEMFEARDLITIIRDQYVECPNKPHCKEYMPLRNLREHYVSCKKLVECPSCGESIETEKWNGHRCPLENEQAVSKAKEKNGASMKLVQDPESKGNQKRLVLHPPQTHFETRAYRRHCDRQALNIYTSPSETLGQAEPAVPRREWQVTCDTRGTAPSVQNSNGENHGPEATSLCQYCQRKVKEINMQRHLNNCTKAPKPCVYCDKMILPETMQMHIQECDRNPDNIPETASEVNDHALVTADVPHEVKGHRQQQDRTGAERNCSPLVADVPVLPVLDVSHAELLEWYIAVQKHLRQLGVFDDTEKFELVSSFLSHCVLNQLADVLTSPPPTHAYECLLIALFRRSKSARSGCEDAFSCDQFLEELPYELAIKLLECEAAMEYIATSSVTVEESGCGSNDREMLFGDADTYFH